GYRWEKRDFIDTFVFDEIFSSEKIPSGNYDTWRTVYEWSNALRKAFGLGVCGLKNIAFMNVSKIAVDGYQSTKTRKNALEYAVFEDKAEQRAQLEAIAPDIVVCGNTGKYLFEILDEKAIKADGIGKNAATGRNPLDLYTVGGYVVFNAYHPSYTQTTTGEEFRELIKRNEGIFAKFHS
ncbi:MAG: hypothetical protein IKZ28_02715, partial [Clostridia bacterium]|nr:hypothetical protein [Clostridia bacterium]